VAGVDDDRQDLLDRDAVDEAPVGRLTGGRDAA
jgi:hypothetical protein